MKRRQILSYLLAVGAGGMVGFAAGRAQARQPHVTAGSHPRVSVDVVHPDGTPFEDFWLHDSRYVAGELGHRYNLRINNHSGHRVEVVVSVDGRDVVSGNVGDYSAQRGYVLSPYGSVTIEGFRQSLDHVASFRFAELEDSYSARRGTPQHTGVIGVAVFDERPRPQARRPVTPAPDPYPYWYGRGDADDAPASEESGAYGGSSGRGRSKSAAPSRNAPAPRGGADAARDYGSRSYDRRESEQMGTSYGESRYSHVREVTFVRRSATQPDSLLTLYYDSYDGLRARGVPVDPPEPYYPYTPEPRPFPERQFAPPPPPRRW